MPKYNIPLNGTLMDNEKYAMLKVDKATHARVMIYISKRHVETGYKMTVAQAINELLDNTEKRKPDLVFVE